MRGKKAQIIIVALWALVILAILAISIGQRVSQALRLSRYQQDKLKSMYLAKTNLNLAINEIFKNAESIGSVEAPTGLDTISSEESRININKAGKDLLGVLLTKAGVANYAELAENICAWRGDAVVAPDYSELGYPNKTATLSNTEELVLVKGVKDIAQESYDKLKNLITVYGSGRVNINTADPQVLEILIEYCKKQLQSQNNNENDPGDLLEKITQARPFSSAVDFNELIRNQGSPASGQVNILNELAGLIDFKSSCFRIHSNGKIKNVSSSIQCVFDKNKKKIVYWHES